MRQKLNKTCLRRLFLSFLLLFVPLAARPAVIVQAQEDRASEVILRVNALRAVKGLPVYLVDYSLMYAAQAQASWSAENNHIGHDGPGGSSPDDRARAAGYGAGFRSLASENAATGSTSFMTPELVVTKWQGDAVHLKGLISPDYEHIGVGYAEAGDNCWYVMMVGWISDDSTAGNPTAAVPPPEDTSVETAPIAPVIVNTPDASGAIYHEVQPGQSAWTIAAIYGVDLADILALNQLTEDSILHPGDRLIIRSALPITSTPADQNTPETPLETPTPTPTSPVLSEIPIEPTVDSGPAPKLPNEGSPGSPSGSIPVPLLAVIPVIAAVAGIVILRYRSKRG
jgi:uncharacterized protein YkwD/LysM repeat protein